jgi:2-polyprenyl-3-methyl-5-hydroxy-6-metoxy-1,4-benzoquinol methylase
MNQLVELQQTLYTSRNPTRRWLHVTRRELVVEAIRTAPVVAAERALEVGPGSGVYLPALCSRFNSVTALDIEPAHTQALAGLAASLPNLDLSVGDLCKTAWHEPFDLVLCSEVVEHVPDPEAFIAGLGRAVRPGGILILSTPQPFSIMELTSSVALSSPFIGLTRRVYQEPVLPTGHISVMRRREVLQHLAEAGFDVLSSRYFGLYVPLLAETGGKYSVAILRHLEPVLNFCGLSGLLWTQLHVARKRA